MNKQHLVMSLSKKVATVLDAVEPPLSTLMLL